MKIRKNPKGLERFGGGLLLVSYLRSQSTREPKIQPTGHLVCYNFLHLIVRTQVTKYQNTPKCSPPAATMCSLGKTCQLEFDQKCVVSSPLSLQRKGKTDQGRTPVHSNGFLYKKPTNTPHFSASPVSTAPLPRHSSIF